MLLDTKALKYTNLRSTISIINNKMEKFTKTSLLFCYYVCIIQFPVCTEAGLMEDLKGLKNKAYEYVYSETCEHPNVRDPEDAIKRKYLNTIRFIGSENPIIFKNI